MRCLNTVVRQIFMCLLLSVYIVGCAAGQRQKHFNMGLTSYRNGDYSAADNHIRAALDIAPENPASRVLLGWIHFKQGRILKAETLFTAVYLENNTDMGALQGLAWVAASREQPDAARGWFEMTLAAANQYRDSPYWNEYPTRDARFILSTISDAHYGLGLLALAAADYPAAQAHLTGALAYRNDFIGHAPIRQALARAHDAAGDYDAAAAVIANLHAGETAGE